MGLAAHGHSKGQVLNAVGNVSGGQQLFAKLDFLLPKKSVVISICSIVNGQQPIVDSYIEQDDFYPQSQFNDSINSSLPFKPVQTKFAVGVTK